MNTIQIQNLTAEEFQQIVVRAVDSALERRESSQAKQNSVIYLTRKETAERLHISLPTLNVLTKDGVVKAYKIRGRVLYREAEVNDCLSEVETLKYKRG